MVQEMVRGKSSSWPSTWLRYCLLGGLMVHRELLLPSSSATVTSSLVYASKNCNAFWETHTHCIHFVSHVSLEKHPSVHLKPRLVLPSGGGELSDRNTTTTKMAAANAERSVECATVLDKLDGLFSPALKATVDERDEFAVRPTGCGEIVI